MKRNIIIISAALLALSGCSSVKDQLGLNKKAPDEFAVVTRAPLSVPPSYELRPPQPGAPRPQEATTEQQAKQTVFETSVQSTQSDSAITKSTLQSPVEQTLLKNADATVADPNIRSTVDKEAGQLLDTEESTVNKILFWHDDIKPTEVLVDPTAEKKRLEKNAEEGKPVTEGETPKTKPKGKTTLDKILN